MNTIAPSEADLLTTTAQRVGIRGKRPHGKSTRTTVNLDQRALDAFEQLREKQGLKTREAIEVAVESFCNNDVLEVVAKLEPDFFDYVARKSVVIAPESLRNLNEIAKRSSHSRDLLLNLCLILTSLAFEKIEEARPGYLKVIYKKLKDISSEINTLEQEAKGLLEENDPVSWRLGKIAVVTDDLVMALNDEIHRGVPVDPDEM